MPRFVHAGTRGGGGGGGGFLCLFFFVFLEVFVWRVCWGEWGKGGGVVASLLLLS